MSFILLMTLDGSHWNLLNPPALANCSFASVDSFGSVLFMLSLSVSLSVDCGQLQTRIVQGMVHFGVYLDPILSPGVAVERGVSPDEYYVCFLEKRSVHVSHLPLTLLVDSREKLKRTYNQGGEF